MNTSNNSNYLQENKKVYSESYFLKTTIEHCLQCSTYNI